MTADPRPQLKMNWRTGHEISAANPPSHYHRRLATPEDYDELGDLMQTCGWDRWRQEHFDYCLSRILPDGWFILQSNTTGQIVASAMSLHNYTGKSPASGTLGWVGCHPDHRGKRLSSVVVAAVVDRLISGGYHEIELYTEHFRSAAIRSYLKLGFVPYLYSDAVTELWKEVCQQVDWPFTPNEWPSGDNAFPTS